uniref:ethanolamine kinase n=1 Tax=Oryzias sinensis TaxID=183150 RepID=A0A8C7Z2H4_9TELE
SDGVSWSPLLLHVDIHIDEHEPRRGILELLSRLRPHWKADDIQMKAFTEGITNQLIGCFVGSLQEPGCVLVRINGRMTDLYVSRDREVKMLQVFHAHGCGPEIYCTFQNGICYKFIPGSVLEDHLLQQPSIYRLIAAEMGRIHSIQPKHNLPVEPLIWTKMSHFLTLMQSSTKNRPTPKSSAAALDMPGHEVLSAEMESLKRNLSQTGSPVVLCHNDLLTKNIIYNSKENMVKFIDYEYADYNYQAFDIGNHFNEFAGSCVTPKIDYSLFVEHRSRSHLSWKGLPLPKVLISLFPFKASNFFWGLWAILQSRFSSIDFDFQRFVWLPTASAKSLI